MTSTYASSILRKILGHASRSKKPQNQTMRADFPKKGNLQKPKPLSFMLILLALLCGRTVAWAQGEWNGSATNGTYTISSDTTINNLTIPRGDTLTLNITGDSITFQFGTITVESGNNNTIDGANLNLNVTGNNVKLKFNHISISSADSKTKAGTVTLINSGSNFIVNKRDKSTSDNNLFYIGRNGSLEVIGTEANPVTFDGEWTMADNGIPTNTNQIANWKAYGVYYSYSGDITFRNVKVKNFVCNAVKGYNAVFRYSAFDLASIMTTELTNVEIYQCYAGPTDINSTPSTNQNTNNSRFGRIIGMNNGILVANCDSLKIHHCFVHEPDECETKISGMGGVIRSQGSVGGTFTIENSSFHHNTYMNRKTSQLTGQGGVINWRSGVDSCGHEGKLVIKNCEFYNNKAKHGGAISTNGRMHLDSVKIYNNEAVCGGGVFFWTYNGRQPAYDGEGFNAVIGKGVDIHDNTATEYGGGAYLTIDASDDVGFNANKQPMSPRFQVHINEGCKIYQNKAPKGAGIAIKDGCPYSHKNIAGSGHPSIWSGEYRRTVTINGGEVYNNYADSTTGPEMAGAGIYIEKYKYDKYDNQNHPLYNFHKDYTDNPDPLAQNNSGTLTVNLKSGKIYNNTAINSTIPGYGGGVYIGSVFTTDSIVSNLNVNIGHDTIAEPIEIYNNQAYTDGGGVYVLYDRTSDRKNQGTVTVKGGTIGKTNLATGNKALHGNGGGICVKGGTVYVNGGNVEYNTAGLSGGGVYVNVPNDQSTTTIQGGANISNNQAKGGGGVYVDKGKLDVVGNVWDTTTQGWEPLDWLTTGTYDPALETTHTRITNNKATDGNGGGINAGNGEVDLTNTLIFNNKASGMGEYKGRGGGVYLDGGTIKINTSKILFDTAYLNGGGVDDHLGSIFITGGDISNNMAINGGGGGVYTNDGDITVWPDYDIENTTITSQQIETQVMPKGTKVDNNKAGKNGGGLNTHTGRFDVRFATITNNEAGMSYGPTGNGGGTGGNGGGLFCEGPHTDSSSYTVRLLHCHLNDNKAYGNSNNDNDLTGRGGGIYLKFGSIFAEHCDILRNEADINGGGLDNHEGELRVYGSYINLNKAKTGEGGGIYTKEGNIVVGPCDSYGFTASKASRIYNNTAHINGGGINNYHGNITIHGDRINNNTAETGDGGGVYIESGKINMYGGQINNNKADQGKGGGVYGGSGRFKIMEREPHPILEIMEMENVTNNSFRVHFHHVDRGLAMDSVAKNKEFGIAYSTNVYPDLPENQEWTTTNWTGVKKITFNVADGNSDSIATTHPEGKYTYVRNEGCSRVIVDSLSAVTTYYVVAYGKYSDGDKNYFDASPAVAVKTYDNNPVVVTGVAFGITTNSASVNGKLLFNGVGTLLEKGIEISSDNGLSWVQHPAQSVGNVFSVTFSGLESSIIYKARAYARCKSEEGTEYESQDAEIIEFTTTGSKAPQGPRSVYPAVDENPFFMELTPLQQAMLANTPEGDTTAAPAPRAITDSDDPNQEKPVDIPHINGNTAMFGGGICIDKNNAELIFAGSTKPDNDSTSNANKKKIIAQINYNYASGAGGGIYIGRESAENYAKMKMMGKCQVNYNHVPADKLGGGIYLDGRLYVGDKSTDDPVYDSVDNRNPVIHGLRVDRNFASSKTHAQWLEILPDTLSTSNPNYADSWSYTSFKPDNSKLNNVFLTRYDYDYYVNINEGNPGDNNISVITLLSDISGKNASDNDKPYSHIGFSVLKGFCPVIATSDGFGNAYLSVESKENDSVPPVFVEDPYEKWLHELMVLAGGESGTAEKLMGAVFEDSESYVAVHTRHNMSPFLGKFIYLWGCWTHPVVMEDPEKRNPMNKRGYGVDFDGHYKIRNPEKYTTDGQGMATGKEALVWEIYSPEGLSWFTSYVNGLNVFDEKEGGKMLNPNPTSDPNGNDDFIPDPNHYRWDSVQNPKANAIIMNDLDMSAYLWVPIGSVKKFYNVSSTGGSLFEDSENVDEATQQPIPDYSHNAHYYRGTFDGQGHIIKGIQGLYLTGIKKFGLFGYLADSAVVKNTFVDEGLFVSDNVEIVYSAGGIAGTMKLRPLGEGEQSKVPVISNSEARMNFNATYSKSGTTVGGLVGDMKNGHVHSCMAMPTITPGNVTSPQKQYMGGLVGKMDAGTTLKNSFSNVLFTTTPDYKVGGIAGENNGLIENVYVRYNYENNTPNLPDGKFYWIAGSNTNGEIKYPYTPNDKTGPGTWWYKGDDGTTISSRSTYTATHLESNKYGFAQDDQKAAAFIPPTGEPDSNEHLPSESGLTYDKDTHTSSLNGLMGALNNWVEAKKMISDTTNPAYNPSDPDFEVNYSTWTRTMASTINDDYPVLMFNDFNVVGTEDGIYMKYDDNVNDMWKKPNYDSLAIADRTGKNFQGLTSYNNPKAAMYLYKTNGVTANDSTPVAINVTGNEAVRLYIHENVGITQTNGAELHARVGVTFDNSNKSLELGGKAYDWHMFSSALQNAPMGLTYNSKGVAPHSSGVYQIEANYDSLQGAKGITHENYTDRKYMDPPVTTWNTDAGTIGYFPTNTPYGTWGSSHRPNNAENSDPVFNQGSFDFYCFHEESRHWINFKREGTENFKDHWHQDIDATGTHRNIPYINEENMKVGKGYMMGVSAVSMLMADGILNNGKTTGELYSADSITNSDYGFNPSGYSEELRGTNLVGNPFQSYLDFDKLVDANPNMIAGNTYYVFDADSTAIYLSYTANSSDNHIMAPGYLHPHQGFFVKTANGGKLTFKNDMRAATGNKHSHFRDGKLNYPLVNLFCYDSEGKRDVTTVEINRPDEGGGFKMKGMRNNKMLIYARWDNADYQTAFTPIGIREVPVRFQAFEDGVFTMRWGTLHGNFHYLHLIDNMTGADVDMLRSEEYRFEATTTDYLSRFKLVFEVTGLEEEDDNEDDNGSSIVNFAFRMGDELIVNGAGYLEVFDVQGRRLSAKRLVDAQSSVSLPNVAAGIYFLRLSDDKQVRTQKMVINY